MRVTPAITLWEKFLLTLTGRYGIFTINLLLLILSIATLWVMLPMIFNSVNNVAELEDISEYMGVMLIGYGVAVEERNSFMQIFKLYPKFTTPLQEHVDHLCHEYGLCYLLLGLFMEMCVACIKIPNAIINTDRLEPVIFGLSAIFLTWNTLLMLRHCWFLVRAKN
jgi:hypothetical protein